MAKHAAAAVLAGILAAGGAEAAVTSTVVDVPVADYTQRFLYVAPDAPVAHILVLSGGDGVLAIQDNGQMDTIVATCGPIARNRQAWAGDGFALSFLDVTSRGTLSGVAEVIEVIEDIRARHDVPIWIQGGSASTLRAAGIAAMLPPNLAIGLALSSPQQLSDLAGTQVRHPALVVSHSADRASFGAATFQALANAPVKQQITLSGGLNFGCGNHLFNGLDAEYLQRTSVALKEMTAAAKPSFQALWYASPAESEPGWGLNIAHQGDTLFATWFTYDAQGPMWLVMSNGGKVSLDSYRGTLYRTTGPAFNASPFDPAAVGATAVGEATFTFTDDGEADFSYTVNGVSGAERITRQLFATPSQCWSGNAPSATNFQDLWYASPAESEAGWGVNVTHQGDTLFATWFTYAAGGKGRWLVMPNLARAAGSQRYGGALYETTGAPFNAYNAAQLGATQVGTAAFEFTGASAGTFTYTVGGATQTKPITRQVFGPTTVCR